MILQFSCMTRLLTKIERDNSNIPFRLMRTLSLVPFPPSQNPLPDFPTRTLWQIPQSSGRYNCSREQNPLEIEHRWAGVQDQIEAQAIAFWTQRQTYQIMRFACSFGWSVAASWHLQGGQHFTPSCRGRGVLEAKRELNGIGATRKCSHLLVARKDFGATTESVLGKTSARNSPNKACHIIHATDRLSLAPDCK